MAFVELLFEHAALTSPPVSLLFGEAITTRFAHINVTLAPPAPHVDFSSTSETAEIAFALPGPVVSVVALWDLAVPSYTTATVRQPWRDGERLALDTRAVWLPVEGLSSGTDVPWRDGERLVVDPELPFVDGTPVHGRPPGMPWRDSAPVSQRVREPWRDAIPVRGYPPRVPWREGTPLHHRVREPWRDAVPLVRSVRSAWRDGVFNLGRVRMPWQHGRFSILNTREPWRDGTVLESHGGPWVRPPDPPVEPCYVPNSDLLFAQLAPSSADLLFVCEIDGVEPPDAVVVVPVRKVYMVFNTFTLRNVETDEYIAATSFSMTLDADSYTWSFNASFPQGDLSKVSRTDPAVPVELEATINGVAYRFLVDLIGRDRSHGSFSMCRAQGRGLGAALDLLVGNYNNEASARTAAQLMDDCLTVNGVGIDWAVDWQLDDWLVPQGAFKRQGTAVQALQAIVGAAGGYLQPHPTDKLLYALHRYPDVPYWDWGTLTPDFELPTAVVTSESMQWVEKPPYTRVFVAAESQGVITRVTREDASEILVAPTVVDPLANELITGAQKGRSILSDTGRIINTSISLPVLPETGIIPPGKLIRYVEGLATKLGLTRAVSVSVTPQSTRQTLEIEIHE